MDNALVMDLIGMDPREQARSVYRAMLGREPENEHSLSLLSELGNLECMVAAVGVSEEHVRRVVRSSAGRELSALLAFVDNAVSEQLRPWAHHRLQRQAVQKFARELNETEFWICIFQIQDGNVFIIEKPVHIMEGKPPNFHSVFYERSQNYLLLLKEAVIFGNIRIGTEIAVYLGDQVGDFVCPIFSFQKNCGGMTVLLPDFELVSLQYLASAPIDGTTYNDKVSRAVFSGSTTGGGALVETAELANYSTFPRLRAARFFAGSNEVDFRLPAIVQCTREVENHLRSEGFGSNPMHWPEAFCSKFIISLDGNGATCSRPAIILKSNCVLVKYCSEYDLFWTNSIKPWLHYIPVAKDEDVPRIVNDERRSPGRFEYIAQEGQRFAEQFLSRSAVLSYTATLIAAYDDLLI